MANRERKTKTPKEPENELVRALEFVKMAQIDKPGEQPLKTHCRIANGFVVAFDGVLAAGYPIADDLVACPHTYRLLDALKRCKSALSVTKLGLGQIAIKSGNFRAEIPCLNPSLLPNTVPDNNAGVISDVIKDGFKHLNPIVSGSGGTTIESSILLQNNSMIATDRHILIEYWHGINLPEGMSVPKVAIQAISTARAKLVGFGYSGRTATFYYDNGAWIRTQLYSEPWPDVGRVINAGDPAAAIPVPPALFDAVTAVLPFGASSAVRLSSAGLTASSPDSGDATYEMSGLPELHISGKYLLAIKDIATKIDLTGNGNVTYFYGDNVRGAITQMGQ